MKDYIKVLIDDVKKEVKRHKDKMEELETRIEEEKIFIEKLEKALKECDKDKIRKEKNE